MAHTETTLTSKEIFNGHVIRVTYDTVKLENGDTSFREVVHHHGGACVLAVTPDDEVYMVRQYRYALGEEIWELPARQAGSGRGPVRGRQARAGRGMRRDRRALHRPGRDLPDRRL